MDSQTLAKAFDPFFTTKGADRGTRLGLSQVYGFVQQSGGQVQINSEPGVGTSVQIYLPRLPDDAEEPEPLDERQAADEQKGTETVWWLKTMTRFVATAPRCCANLGITCWKRQTLVLRFRYWSVSRTCVSYSRI